MVDALRRAHQMVKPDGCVVDLHPSAELASVDVGSRTTGHVDGADAPLRHAAAGVALSTVIAEGLFAIERSTTFSFYTHADTIEELRDYVEENWRNATIDDRTVARTRQALRDVPGARPRTCEHVYVTRLRPCRR
jgi:hypothetical protein